MSADRDRLEALVAVAREGGVGRAAERLGRTQPSISARIAALESDWGVRLFVRRARGMVPTPEAQRLLPLADRALAALEAVDRQAGGTLAEDDGLRVGAGDAIGRELLPRVLRRMQREGLAGSVRVIEGSRARLLDTLRRGEIDVALVSDPRLTPGEASGSEFETSPLIRSRVVVLTSTDDGVARYPLRLRELARRPLVGLHEGSSFRRVIEHAFRRAGEEFRPAVEVGSLSLVRRYVAAGLGMAPVPEIAFGSVRRLSGVRIRPVSGIATLPYVGVLRAGAPVPVGVRRLLEILASGEASG